MRQLHKMITSAQRGASGPKQVHTEFLCDLFLVNVDHTRIELLQTAYEQKYHNLLTVKSL